MKFKENKGITLIALVITIIVLIILAGVSINLLFGQYGIVTRAQGAKQLQEQAQLNEQIALNEVTEEMDRITGNSSQTYTAYTRGQTVTVKNKDGVEQSFYVLNDSSSSESTVTLLAAKNIDTISLAQSDSAGKVAFSSTNYWSSISGITYPYDLNNTATSADTDAIAKAKAYGEKFTGGTGRLMTVEEAFEITGLTTSGTISSPDWIKATNYWLGSAGEPNYVWIVYNGRLNSDHYSIVSYYGVRPVIEISKSLILS